MAEKILTVGAGHGINTPGKRCLKSLDKNETREWVLNNRVVNYVMEGLKVYDGLKVIRLDDPTGKRDVPLKERTDKANKANADLLLSIHHNAGINGGSGGGVVVYRYPNSTMTTKAMQKSLYNKIVAKNKLKGNRANPLPEANFHMLRESKMPALLVENGFMDSKTDVPIILTDAHARKTAEGIVEFVVEHFKLKKKPVPKPTPKPATKGFYRVVVGSYKDKDNAIKQQEKLKKAGFNSFLAYYED